MQVILIKSDSKRLMDEKIAEFSKDILEKAILSYPENTIDDILEEASFVSMFGDKKCVLVKNASFFGSLKLTDKDTEKLIKYFNNPNLLTTLIFTTYEDIDSRKNITKSLINQNAYVEIKAPKNYELLNVVRKKMSKYQIKEEALKYLIEASLNNYDIILNEIEKLSLYYKEKDTIRIEELKKMIPMNLSDNVFKFVDAVVAKDSFNAINLYENFLTMKTDPLQLLNLLGREYRLLYCYKLFEEKKYSPKEMASELKLQDWQVNKLRKEASLYHKDDLKTILVDIFKLDLNIKSGRVDKVIAFYAFLVKIMSC